MCMDLGVYDRGSDSDRENLAEAAGLPAAYEEGPNPSICPYGSGQSGKAGGGSGCRAYGGGLREWALDRCGDISDTVRPGPLCRASVYDVRLLLAGEKVGLIKTAKDWHMTVERFSGCREMKIEEGTGRCPHINGILGYCFFLKESGAKAFRAMDAVEYHMRKVSLGFA